MTVLSMHSKPLRQKLQLGIDTLGMRGEYEVSEVVDFALRIMTPEDWALADRTSADRQYLSTQAKKLMVSMISIEILENFGVHIPEEYAAALSGLPANVCVSARGGRHAKWRHVITVSLADWKSNLALRDMIAEYATQARDHKADIVRLLVETGSDSIADLLSAPKAA